MTRSIFLRHSLVAAFLAIATVPLHAEATHEIDSTTLDEPTSATDDVEIEWSLLDSSADAIGQAPAGNSRTLPDSALSWSTHDNADGSAALTVKRAMSEFWDTRFGADMTVARPESTQANALPAVIAGNGAQSSGTAWMAMSAPGVGSVWDSTAIEARLDPAQNQSRIGASLSKSLPLVQNESELTLRNGTSVVQQGGMLIGSSQHDVAIDQSARLSNTESGTSLTAGRARSSADERWLHSVGAEQKLASGVSIAGRISETPFGGANRSLTATFRQSW